MGDRTLIEVTEATWNPITGCSPVSPGCRRCYAARFAKRLAGRYGYPKDDPFSITLHEDRMDQPIHWKKPRHIFVGSMGDLFHLDVPNNALNRVFEVMDRADHHTYMIITKRPEKMSLRVAAMEPKLKARLSQHVWVGVSAEDQKRAEERLPILLRSWPGLKLVCLEPLLGPVDISPWIEGIDWVIVGGETGPSGERTRDEWVRSLHKQCQNAKVPFFLKSLGGRGKPRVLDGRLWEEMPQNDLSKRKQKYHG